MKGIRQALLVVVLCNGLVACTTSREPTYGEMIRDEGTALKSVGEQWSTGEALVERGEKRIRDGQKRVRDGERMIEEGREMSREGTELMRESRLRYEQRDGQPIN